MDRHLGASGCAGAYYARWKLGMAAGVELCPTALTVTVCAENPSALGLPTC